METKQRILAAIFFAVLWTAWMAWWTDSVGLPDIIILGVCGALAGSLWAWLFGLWMNRYLRRQRDAADIRGRDLRALIPPVQW